MGGHSCFPTISLHFVSHLSSQPGRGGDLAGGGVQVTAGGTRHWWEHLPVTQVVPAGWREPGKRKFFAQLPELTNTHLHRNGAESDPQ